MNSDRHAELLAKSDRACLTAPAGTGKTEMIAKAIACQSEGRQLVLTHTHAGVKALRDRLRKLNVPPRYYYIDTIAGWSLKYASAFPVSSGLTNFLPTDEEWDKVYKAVGELLSNSSIKKIVSCSYNGLYVDEYQDCVLLQHEIILKIANIVPCRVVGDPLQGIFEFAGPLVNWSSHVKPNFTMLPELTTPWRWRTTNPNLGKWLAKLRNALVAGDPIDLQSEALHWMELSPRNRRAVCFDAVQFADGTIVAIEKWPQAAHKLASSLKGTFTSMEEIECRDLLKWCETIDSSSGAQRAVSIVDFASKCMTKISSELRTIKARLISGNLSTYDVKKHANVALALSKLTRSQDLGLVIDGLNAIKTIKPAILYRRELWNEMIKTITACQQEKTSLKETAWQIRNRASSVGRTIERRIVSRTPLAKGLEFDHAIVLNADVLNAKELYVAMTRGSKSLTVLSSDAVVNKPRPFQNGEMIS